MRRNKEKLIIPNHLSLVTCQQCEMCIVIGNGNYVWKGTKGVHRGSSERNMNKGEANPVLDIIHYMYKITNK